ncbi:MAG: hypothetical protein OXI81_01435 [Paracoccaceae bacterium]|nr:hypothetical protein [Paracoccaceae bacterium]
MLVPELFAPAYIGGRTAAKHWTLTEQFFKNIFEMTAQSVGQKRQERYSTFLLLKHSDEPRAFDTKNVRHRQTRVPISDAHHPNIDMLERPTISSGIEPVSDCLAAYRRRDDPDDENLVRHLVGLGNGAVFKRLGFLAERFSGGVEPVQLSGGHAKRGPVRDGSFVVTKWWLRVPEYRARKETI